MAQATANSQKSRKKAEQSPKTVKMTITAVAPSEIKKASYSTEIATTSEDWGVITNAAARLLETRGIARLFAGDQAYSSEDEMCSTKRKRASAEDKSTYRVELTVFVSKKFCPECGLEVIYGAAEGMGYQVRDCEWRRDVRRKNNLGHRVKLLVDIGQISWALDGDARRRQLRAYNSQAVELACKLSETVFRYADADASA